MANRTTLLLWCLLLPSYAETAMASGDDAIRGTVPTVTEVVTLHGSNPVVDDGFGAMVAIDGNVVVVGAQGGTNNADNNAVYIYQRSVVGLDDWTEVKQIEPPTPALNNELQFPGSLTLQDDVLYVGDRTAEAVWIYQRNLGGPSNWGLAGIVTVSDHFGDDADFGIAVAVDNDILVVGTIDGEFFNGDQGRAYIFERGAGGLNDWTVARKLDPDDLQQQPAFGRAVAVSGDVVTISDPVFPNGGRVYVYERNAGGAGNWDRVQLLGEDDDFGQQNYGAGTTISGSTLVVGATGHNVADSDAGAAFVYQRDGGTWLKVKTITASNAASFQFFGDSPSLIGDLLFVGNLRSQFYGSVYYFLRDQGGLGSWGELGQFSSATVPLISDFGRVNASSPTNLVVGAPNKHPAQDGPGQAFIYRIESLSTECTLQALPLTFGDVDSGLTVTATLSLTNAGSGPCVVSSIGLSGDLQFSVAAAPALPLTIDADHSVAIDVSYAAAATGTHTGSIAIASDDADNPTRTVAVTASSVARCNVAVDPTLPIVFEAVLFGQTATRSIRLENLGSEACVVSSVELDACCTDGYTLGPGVPQTPFVLTRGSPVITEVNYVPSIVLLESATLDIASTDADEPTIRVWLRGTGAGGCRLVEEDSQIVDGVIDFGDIVVNQSPFKHVEIRNRGDEPCTLGEREIIGSEAFTGPPNIPGAIINPNAAFIWTFYFAPTGPGQQDAVYRIDSNDVLVPVFELQLTGNALPSPDCDLHADPSTLDFGDVAVGASASLQLALANEGLSDCVVTGLTLSGSNEFSGPGQPLPVNIQVGAPPIVLTYTYTPVDDSADAGAVTVSASDPFDPIQVVSLSGRDADSDGDGFNDLLDNCQLAANPTQLDTDQDGFGNLCDQDLNNDCRVNFIDLNIFKSMFFTCCNMPADFDGNTAVNLVDLLLLRNAFFGTPGPSGLDTVCSL